LLFVEASSQVAVGTGGFKGEPVAGRVEVGYGVAESHRRKGVATEAICQLVGIALQQPGVTEVYAETSVENLPSRRVVQRVGFLHIGRRMSDSDGLVDQWLFKATEA